MNAHTDALSKLATLNFEYLGKDILVEVIKEKSIIQPLEVSQAETDDTWMTPIFNYLSHCSHNHPGHTQQNVWHALRVSLCNSQSILDEAEVANKEVVKGIKKQMEVYMTCWVDELSSVLWAHRTTPKESTGETPFSLVFGIEAVIPVKALIHTERVAMVMDDKNEDSCRLDLALAKRTCIWDTLGKGPLDPVYSFMALEPRLGKTHVPLTSTQTSATVTGSSSLEDIPKLKELKIKCLCYQNEEQRKEEGVKAKFHAKRVPFDQRNNPPQHPRVVYLPILDINYFRHFLITFQNLYPMDDEPMWAVDRVVTPTAIKGNHLTLIKGNQFDGRIKTDPHKHIHEFLEIYDMFKYRDTENEVVRLMMFPLSLIGEAKTWLDELNKGTIKRWDELRTAFISRFFPLALFDRLLGEIRAFSQHENESLTDAWLRMK
ncbi:reverse transcriptase domain-containing protein [Tanacetum coccineum]|uniref:Reverse transcriptase domain-containing protein n=1 Tax=Tanacetum coccineum TaxID=301880 RepID=A0ABQ4Y3A3_9ASTR